MGDAFFIFALFTALFTAFLAFAGEDCYNKLSLTILRTARGRPAEGRRNNKNMDKSALSRPLLLDGATGTELQKRGMPRGVSTEAWILEHPKELLRLQRDYVEAGCQVLTAPTFGANPASLQRCGLGESVETVNRRLVHLSREAAQGKALVAGNLAPCGLGEFGVREGRFEDVVENYKVQARALHNAGVDLYLVETMVDMAEARAAVLAIREVDEERPVVVSFCCDDEGRTPSGVDVLAGLIVMQGMQVDAFGLNCAPAEVLLEQLERLAPYATIPLLAQPNGGDWPEDWVERCAALGVRLFGGCCGTEAADIQRLHDALERVDIGPFHGVERDPDVIPCASEREARFITPDVDVSEPIPCTSNLMEDILAVEKDTPVGAIMVEIMEEDDIHIFAEHQYAVEDALCFWCDVPELLEKALRIYQGRAFYDGTCGMDAAELRHLVEKYGLIML